MRAPARRHHAARQTRGQQITARRRFPIEHFACAEHAGQGAQHQAVVERVERHDGKLNAFLRFTPEIALEDARRALLPLADREGFEIEFSAGTLNLLFEEPSEARFVVSPNAPVRQIWVSAMSRSYKLPWSPELGAFALDGETLAGLLTRLTRTFLDG